MDEAIIICKFLGVNPMDFAEEEQNERKCGKEHAHYNGIVI